MRLPRVLLDLALSPVAGYAGTKAMEPVSMRLYELEPAVARTGEDAARPGPPYRVAAEKITQALGVNLSEKRLRQLSLVLHYGLAVQGALLCRRTGLSPLTAGLVTGAAMSLVADELMTPAFRFSAPNLDYPLVTHARGFAAHLVFGLAVAGTVEAGWAAFGRRP